MQHIASAPFDDRPPRHISRHAPAAALACRLAGETADALAREMGWQPSGASALGISLADAHASADDLIDLRLADRLSSARIRLCLCCRRPIISAHSGVRMCVPCRQGHIDARW